MAQDKKQDDGLGEPGEIREYDRTEGPDTIRGDELNPNRESDTTPIYVNGDITLQTAEESERDDQTDPTKDDTMQASNDDINQPIPPRMAGDSNQGVGDRSVDDDDTAE
ncbi:hypothetical protein SAMN05444008_11697 [Cnuella takakiae]|uniref:Uncharacterized protein n=1 Tax=Cnuella takakiae TaxID=1302690 RepID=A0A1M5GJE2_9BACT|nr:hypothetical protein [Cnuella takakiae]SHG03622.1 hypothetical protein SAMN05444008_11697 [Cnuella takakiae]